MGLLFLIFSRRPTEHQSVSQNLNRTTRQTYIKKMIFMPVEYKFDLRYKFLLLSDKTENARKGVVAH